MAITAGDLRDTLRALLERLSSDEVGGAADVAAGVEPITIPPELHGIMLHAINGVFRGRLTDEQWDALMALGKRLREAIELS